MRRDEEMLAGLKPSRPPAELRRGVLGTARRAAGLERRPRTVWDVLWESRALRRAWAGAVSLLVVGHGLVALWPQRGPEPRPLRAGPGQGGELREVLDLPSIDDTTPMLAAGSPTAPGTGRTS